MKLATHDKSLLRASPWETALLRARREIAADLRTIIECSTASDKRGRPRMDTLDPAAAPHVKRKQLIIAAIDRVLK